MNELLTEHEGGYCTSVHRLLQAARYFRAHPEGRVSTGMWTNPTWTATEFWQWFDNCLDAKINRQDRRRGRKLAGEYQLAQRIDARLVNDYYGRRLRAPGSRGLLRTPEMRRRYPGVNCQEREV